MCKLLYILSLISLLALYIFIIMNMKHMKNTRLYNVIFASIIFICYLCVVIRVYFSVGFNDWNFKNTLPVANVSPFMFTLVGVVFLFPVGIRRHLYLLFSLLSVGMLLSTIFACIYNAAIDYKFHLHFLADYISHVALSLWGVYLIRSGQVRVDKRGALISCGIIIGAAFVMMMLNVIFDTAFFGLSLNGKHNIYNTILTDNSYLSAALYFVGLLTVLLLGYLYSLFFARKNIVHVKTAPTQKN